MHIQILRNAHIYTGDNRHPWAQTLAIVGNQVTGLDADAEAWAAMPQAHIQDLAGATVIPGLIDAHIHFMWYGLSLQELSLRDVSRKAMLEQVAARATELPPGTWIRGRGWDQNIWQERHFPTATELDRVAPQHPVVLIAKNAHALVANSTAMRIAKVNSETADPPYGKLGRDSRGQPTGMFFERASDLIKQVIPEPTLDDIVQALEIAQQHLLAAGITGVHDVDGQPAFTALQELRRQGRQKVRVVKYIRRESLDAVLETGLRTGMGDDWLKFGGLKLFADGALGSRTGAMFAPYEGEPDNLGLLTLEPAYMQELASRAAKGGLALAIHAIGDRANHLVVNVLEAAKPLNPHLRHRIEHVQLITPEDRNRLAQAGLVASMQPIHAIHDMEMADRHLGQRAAHAYTWRSVLESGAVLAFGSDAPIEVFNPFLGLYAAVTRCREDGTPSPNGWYPEQRLTLQQALRAYTWGAAYAAGQETRLGLLAPGYYADLIALNQDIFNIPPSQLLDTKVERVMVNGIWQHNI